MEQNATWRSTSPTAANVLENGRIVMEDTHEQLREKNVHGYLGMKEAARRATRKKKKMWR